MWFIFSLTALLCWSGSDLFSKIGCQDGRDKYSHLKMVMAVGLVMGLHALYQLIFAGVKIDGKIILAYLPVSALYISSMAIGYLGLRYIELSILSPICNSSGAIVAVASFITMGSAARLPLVAFIAVALVCMGVIFLGITEATEDEELRRARQDASNHRYAKSWLALALPIIYCLLDAAGTFADSIILERLNEDSANVAYELTFLAVGIVCAVYVLGIKKHRLVFRQESPKYTAAIFETEGQFFYIYALADSRHVVFTVPIISAYCAASVLWGRIFLKEKLSVKHYLSILLVIIGVIILGILDI